MQFGCQLGRSGGGEPGNHDSQDEAGLMKGYKFSRAWCLVEIGASGDTTQGWIAYGDGRES